MRLNTPTLAALAALAAGGMLAVPTFAAAQTLEEVVILPDRLGPDGRPIQMSRVVSYADLDLTTLAGQDVLKMRVRDTARDICRELGEANRPGDALTAACVTKAVANARDDVERAIASAWTPRYAVAPAAPYVASVGEATSASDTATDVSATVPAPAPAISTYTETTVTNGPVADTPENRARYGQPMSNAGKRTAPANN